MVVKALVWHWVALMVEKKSRQDECRWDGRHQISLFYMDDDMVASADPGWLQGGSSTLVGMLD